MQITRKMIANLKERDRVLIQPSLLGLNSPELLEAEVQEVTKDPEGWHQVKTNRGNLKPMQPTEKLQVV